MAFNGDIKFKGTSSKAYPLTITTPPQITHSELYVDEYNIPGKNGTLYGANPYRGSATISASFALVADEGLTSGVSKFQTSYRSVRQWLQGTGTLILGDSTDSYYEVQKVVIASDERAILRYGNLQVEFTVYPFEFLNAGDTAIDPGNSIKNEGDLSCPLYKITGSGSGTLTVDSKTMTYTVDGELYIDTRRFIAYDALGNNKNSVLAGDYEDLRLDTGTHSISASAGTLKIYPKWGYNL